MTRKRYRIYGRKKTAKPLALFSVYLFGIKALLLILVSAASALLTDRADESPDPDAVTANAALVPLGTPLLAGPGAIVAAMVAVESAATPVVGWVSVVLALLATHVVIWLALRFSLTLHRVLGDSAIRVLTRILGLLLAAIAVQMIADGVLAYIAVLL